MNQYLYTVQTVRPAMLHNPTDDEVRIGKEHIDYMQNLITEGQGIFAGATTQRDQHHFGVFVYEAEDDAAGKAIVENDPAVKNRIMRAQWYPYRVALWNVDAADLEDGMCHYFYKIQTVRPDMLVDNGTEFEQKTTSDHFMYLKGLTEQGVFCIIGRTMTPDYSSFGLGVLRAHHEEEARELTNNDPVIKNRVMRAELYPFAIAAINRNR